MNANVIKNYKLILVAVAATGVMLIGANTSSANILIEPNKVRSCNNYPTGASCTSSQLCFDGSGGNAQLMCKRCINGKYAAGLAGPNSPFCKPTAYIGAPGELDEDALLSD